jgi:hypothetical protein
LLPLQEISAHVQGGYRACGGEEELLGPLIIPKEQGDVACEEVSVRRRKRRERGDVRWSDLRRSGMRGLEKETERM